MGKSSRLGVFFCLFPSFLFLMLFRYRYISSKPLYTSLLRLGQLEQHTKGLIQKIFSAAVGSNSTPGPALKSLVHIKQAARSSPRCSRPNRLDNPGRTIFIMGRRAQKKWLLLQQPAPTQPAAPTQPIIPARPVALTLDTPNRNGPLDLFNNKTSIGSKDVEELRDAFYNLQPAARLTLKKMADHFAQMEAELSWLQQEIARPNEEVWRLEDKLARRDQEIASLKEPLQRLELEKAEELTYYSETSADELATSLVGQQKGRKKSVNQGVHVRRLGCVRVENRRKREADDEEGNESRKRQRGRTTGRSL
ncbi:hypothetical protein QBC46DRAFT_408540 [Diplogelasinospora grovesii]|uniref:Uncharacterized protein n=1 Tax=Diplogelasinospora grovesii TaxID=303347 RepID=A0AAN6N8I2_9PEZI|nr:hypothetical protein QBC46DRAFT_408540 [Diplogelasinospora grovesii]